MLTEVVLAPVVEDRVLSSVVVGAGVPLTSTFVGEELTSVDVQTVVLLSTGVFEGVVTSVEVLTGLLLTREVDDIVLHSAVGGTVVFISSTVVCGLASFVVMTGVMMSTGIL
jgi:hypothetical protein